MLLNNKNMTYTTNGHCNHISENATLKKITHCIIPLIWNYKTAKTSQQWQKHQCLDWRRGRLTVREHEGIFQEYGDDGLYSEWWQLYLCTNVLKYSELSMSTFS